jgi:hypothetical protein
MLEVLSVPAVALFSDAVPLSVVVKRPKFSVASFECDSPVPHRGGGRH